MHKRIALQRQLELFLLFTTCSAMNIFSAVLISCLTSRPPVKATKIYEKEPLNSETSMQRTNFVSPLALRYIEVPRHRGSFSYIFPAITGVKKIVRYTELDFVIQRFVISKIFYNKIKLRAKKKYSGGGQAWASENVIICSLKCHTSQPANRRGRGGRGVALLSAAMERKLRCSACGLIVNVEEW